MSKGAGIIIGAISFTVGGVVGYLVGKKVTIKVFENEIDKAVEEIKGYYEEEKTKILNTVNEDAEKHAQEVLKRYEKPDISTFDKPYFDKVEKAVENNDYVESEEDRLNREYMETCTDEERQIIEENIRLNAFEDGPKIYTIDEATYSSKDNDYNLEHLTFYKDEILAYTDDPDDILHEIGISQTIGDTEMLHDISRINEGPVYIRNDILETDYEIECVDKTYAEANGHEPF